ncbi:HupE/UreJ family protein [Marinivivus vitaminiproducens]|uniref:HupE/UreJ family protein n=1 Tax=Marinivivus vitaminiproducens TaxID=3035935 RepID=UPI0027A4D4C4|nr:HupE/UreJ family protein [Geminicoccaceae bacterium SCSIO 64248]
MHRFLAVIPLAVSLAVALPAEAHTGVGPTGGFASGFAHPLFGLDHLLAMIAVGVWASLLGGRALWLVPAAFVAVMAVGGGAGMLGVPLPMVELMIGGSVVVLGLLVALGAKPATVVAMAVVGLFALFHGHAHGTEMHEGVNGLTYGLGFVLATALLHAAGIGLGTALGRLPDIAVRAGGGAVAAAGLALMIG